MSSYQKKSDWGCLAWFLLAFGIFLLVTWLIVLVASPSGGSGGPCQSLSNLDRLGRGNSTGPVKRSSATGGVTHVSLPVGTTGGGGSKPAPAPRPVSPVKPAPAPKPVKPNLEKPKTQQPPQGGSGGSHKAPKVKIDLEDCD